MKPRARVNRFRSHFQSRGSCYPGGVHRAFIGEIKIFSQDSLFVKHFPNQIPVAEIFLASTQQGAESLVCTSGQGWRSRAEPEPTGLSPRGEGQGLSRQLVSRRWAPACSQTPGRRVLLRWPARCQGRGCSPRPRAPALSPGMSPSPPGTPGQVLAFCWKGTISHKHRAGRSVTMTAQDRNKSTVPCLTRRSGSTARPPRRLSTPIPAALSLPATSLEPPQPQDGLCFPKPHPGHLGQGKPTLP